MLCDFHLHTCFSGDSDTPPARQIEQAIALGMKQICVTDHHDYGVQTQCDFRLDLDAYFPAMERLRQQYQDQIRIEIGVELGLQCRVGAYLEELAGRYPFDFIIGSSHFIDGQDPYYPEYFQGRSEADAYRRFFESSLKRVQTLDCFDSYGHLDYVVRYGPARNQNYSYEAYQDLIDPILKTLIEKGKGLECNTGGLRYGLGHPNPCEDILRRYRQLGGEILTIGSDAHSPEQVGYGFQTASRLLAACGFRYYTVFHRRKPEFLPLDA